ncbi:MAG: hypothetical protein L6W00_13125 [Lentisphaeria bacterium]|nr:MAG: hypothetical protein L6W00_13125 [Lentisphaeria bacterium]
MDQLLSGHLQKYGADHLELWQGEAGFPSVTSETEALAGVPMNEEIQARLLLRSLLTDLYLENDYTSYFTISDFKYYYKNGFRNKPNYFGLLTTDTPPRPKKVVRRVPPHLYAFRQFHPAG